MSDMYYGTPVVPGIGYAPVLHVHRPDPLPQKYEAIDRSDCDSEVERFEKARETVSDRLMNRALETVGAHSEILMMASSLAMDPALNTQVKELINHDLLPAPYAVDKAIDAYVTKIRAQGGLIAERATDLLDIKQRIIAQLQGDPEPGIPVVEQPTVLCADDLAPADTAGLQPNLIEAIVTAQGGPTSHTSIIARQMGIPCIVAARSIGEIDEGVTVLVNGQNGRIELNPDPQRARALVQADKELRRKAQSWEGPALTTDGHHVQLLANVQDAAGAKAAAETPAEGIGLFRTELCFLTTQTEPTVESQTQLYSQVFAHFPSSKIVVRTLDAGSDKPIAWINQSDEDNPALGVRGIRTSGIHEGVIPHQLDAIAVAAKDRLEDIWVMAPMVSTISEARWFAQMVHERGLKAGIMVEVPAVAIKADAFMEEVDFVSLGTNDLTQYVMAADRINSHLATYTQSWQPAVLDMISATAAAGQKAGKPVGVCGEAGADPLLACVLVGMGVTSLSMARSAIGTVGVALSSVSFEQCQAAAQAVSAAKDCEHARQLANEHLHLISGA